MNLKEILQASNFGERIAEKESGELARYFVETEQWRRILSDRVDIVYGAKGSGKSAVYSLLAHRKGELLGRDIKIVSAEKPRGTPIFKGLQQDPPTTEDEFIGLWKLYILSLIDAAIDSAGSNRERDLLHSQLLEAGLVGNVNNLSQMLQNAFRYVRSWFRPGGLEGGVSLDPITGLPTGFSGKIIFSPSGDSSQSQVFVDELLRLADKAVENEGKNLWILLDRLDVAFAESLNLEENALRALFRVYLDILDLQHITPKVFLRSDIWSRITRSGFREASHITRAVTIEWNAESLLNLIVKRLLKNPAIEQYLDVDATAILDDIEQQRRVFYRIFPGQVDIGERKPNTFDWILSRVADGSKKPAPREIIHLVNVARDVRLREHEIGSSATEQLFSRASLKSSLPTVSEVRLNQTLLAEYPDLRNPIEKLRGQKTEQYPDTLSQIWGVSDASAVETATQLADAGFFELRGTNSAPVFWVPFLYRDAAEMVQGAAR